VPFIGLWLCRARRFGKRPFTPEELKALDVESSQVIDLEKFVPRGDLDPVYLAAPGA
jgi:hypothetical protein